MAHRHDARRGHTHFPKNAAEKAAGVPIVNEQIEPGNVLRYGAVGNGSTDDTVALQYGLDYSAQSKNAAYLPGGTYLTSAALVMDTASTLLGEGEFRSRILHNNATGNVISAASKSLLTIRGLEIYFNVTRTAGSAIVFTSVSQYIINDVRILAPYNGLTFVTCTAGQVDHVRITTGTGGWNRGVYVQDCTSSEFRHIDCVYGAFTPAGSCFEIQSDCDTIQFFYCQGTSSSTGECIAWLFKNSSATVPPRWIKLFGCTAEGGNSGDFPNAKPGFQVEAGTSIEFTNCYAAVSEHGLRITGGNDIRWRGGEILANARHGVFITGGTGILVSEASIHNNSRETATTYDGINVGAAATNFKFLDNDIGTRANFSTSSAHRYDIAIEAFASDNYIVTGNNLLDGNTGGLLDLGTGTIKIVKDNMVASSVIGTLDNTGTPSITQYEIFKTGGTTAITDFDDGHVGKTIKILSAHSVTITDGTPIILNGGANFTMVATDTLTLTMFDDQVWQEVSRSVN